MPVEAGGRPSSMDSGELAPAKILKIGNAILASFPSYSVGGREERPFGGIFAMEKYCVSDDTLMWLSRLKSAAF